MKVFISDDEEPARERLKELLADIATEVPTTVVGEAKNGLETVERLPQTGADSAAYEVTPPAGDLTPSLPQALQDRLL